MSARDILMGAFLFSDPQMMEKLLKISKTELIPKGSILVESGERQTLLPILLNGIFRGFLLDAEGRDITDCFACRRGDAVVGCNAPGEPSFISIEAITDCEVLLLPMDTVLEQLNTDLTLMRLYNHYLWEALSRHWEAKLLMHRCRAMQRYGWFLRNYPGMIDSVSNKHIASFLGMTPVTLSRLRRQLREEVTEKR